MTPIAQWTIPQAAGMVQNFKSHVSHIFLRFFTVRFRTRVGISVSVSFSVCKPGQEWKVGHRERIPTASSPSYTTDT